MLQARQCLCVPSPAHPAPRPYLKLSPRRKEVTRLQCTCEELLSAAVKGSPATAAAATADVRSLSAAVAAAEGRADTENKGTQETLNHFPPSTTAAAGAATATSVSLAERRRHDVCVCVQTSIAVVDVDPTSMRRAPGTTAAAAYSRKVAVSVEVQERITQVGPDHRLSQQQQQQQPSDPTGTTTTTTTTTTVTAGAAVEAETRLEDDPATANTYFAGGYLTRRYSCGSAQIAPFDPEHISAIQVETPIEGRATPAILADYGARVAAAMVTFARLNLGLDL